MISHPHKVIFVHIPKCAGQSIEMAFLNDLGLSWETRSELLLKPNSDPSKGPARLAHLFAHEYIDLGYISQNDFDNYFKFAIVRNPISRIVSELNFRNIKKSIFYRGFSSIEMYINTIEKNYFSDEYRHICPQIEYLYNATKENLLVKNIIKFESINMGFLKISDNFFKNPTKLPKINSRKIDIWKVHELSDSDIRFLRDYYKADFKEFDY